MPGVISTNILALNAHRNLKAVGNKNALASEKLSSGVRINRAADDAAGSAISEKMKTQIRGMMQAQRNVEDGINLIQTMDGGMSNIQDIMVRQRELIVQALNDTNEDTDKDAIQLEIDQLNDEIEAIASRSEFNKMKLLNVDTGHSITKTTPIYETVTEIETIPIYKTEYRYTLDVIATQISQDVYDTPAVDSNGRFNFFALNSGGDTTQLLFGDYSPGTGGSPGTSFPAIRINTGSDVFSYGLWSSVGNGAMSHLNTAYDSSSKNWESHYQLKDPSKGLDFEVVQRVSIVSYGSEKTETVNLTAPDGTDLSGTYTYWDGGQSYCIEYEVINKSTNDFSFDFLYHVDTAAGGSDNSPFVEPNSTTALNSTTWVGNAIPDSLWMYNNINQPLVNVEMTFKDTANYNIAPGSEPDKVTIGNWTSAADFGYVAAGENIGDSAYSVVWNNREAGAGVDDQGEIILSINNEAYQRYYDTTNITDTSNTINPTDSDIVFYTNGSDTLLVLKDLGGGAFEELGRVNSVDLNSPINLNGMDTTSSGSLSYEANNTSSKMVTYLGVASPPADVMSTIGDVIEYTTVTYEEKTITKEVLKGYATETEYVEGDDALWIQCGANSGQGVRIDRYDCRPDSLYRDILAPATITINDNGSQREVTLNGLVTKPREKASASLIVIDLASEKVSEYRSRAGAQQNRLEYTSKALAISFTNLEEANSRILDTDMAKEMMALTKSNVLQQAAVSMLAQANQSPQKVLELIK